MRIVFCGSGTFGLPTLRRLAAGDDEIVGAVTQPPRRAGRGGKRRPTPLAEAAAQLGLPVTPVEDINAPASVAALADLSSDAMVVADFGQMIRAPARAAGRLGAFNLHGSLLPELRGAAPVNWAVIRGHATTGVTCFRLVDRMDAGEIFSQRQTDIRPDETAEELHDRLAELGVETVLETLGALAAGRTQGRPQDHSLATRAPLLTKADGAIDFSADAAAIRDLIHGTWPWPGGRARYVPVGGKAIDVTLARARALPGEPPAAAPGAVRDDLTVAVGRGSLEIRQLKPAGRRLMAWRDFVNGYRVRPGARFTRVSP